MKTFHTLALLAIAGTLGGCMGGGAAGSNRSLDSVHQPIVSNRILTFDVATMDGDLAPSEQGKLEGWLDAMGVSYGDRIAIEDPALYGRTAATATIRRMVERRGLMVSDAVPVTAGAIAPGYVRVSMTRATAYVPGCPNWDSRGSASFGNATSSNYGCATNSNLAAMVADPRDLVKGAESNGADTATAAKPIRVYRDAEPTGKKGLKASSTSNAGAGQ